MPTRGPPQHWFKATVVETLLALAIVAAEAEAFNQRTPWASRRADEIQQKLHKKVSTLIPIMIGAIILTNALAVSNGVHKAPSKSSWLRSGSGA